MRLIHLALWLVFVVLIAVMSIGSELPTKRQIAAANMEGPVESKRDSSGNVSVTLRRAPDSHFYAEARINGKMTRVMVDSGATVVALRRRDAEAMGIDVESLPIAGEARTAGGVVPMRAVMLDEVDIGGLKERRVQAAIVDLPEDQEMPATLLGQSYLARLESVEIRGDELVMR